MSEPEGSGKTHRVIAYVDGFNLYYGIMSKGWIATVG